MKIRRIEFENFRNFKDHGEIKCSTDGKVTIIYGKNGDGKTTLHQLLQWILYGQVHFNKTTTDRLYNLKYESECSLGDIFEVMGRIDFIHDNREYSLTRTIQYKKNVTDSEKLNEDFTLNMMNDDNDWRRVERPKEVVEKLLPQGLSDYFFFDGESMISDLRLKGKDSAGKLRKALYSIFDLDLIENAISHIGRTDLKTTALGKVYLSKGNITSGNEISNKKSEIERIQNGIEKVKALLELDNNKKKKYKNLSQNISEKIGSYKSKVEYENERKNLLKTRDRDLKLVSDAEEDFGNKITEIFPLVLISRAIEDAKKTINLKIEECTLPKGLNKDLIKYLTSDKTDTCICGNPLCQKEKDHINEFLNLLPPNSYKALYNNFSERARSFTSLYNKDLLEKYIRNILDFQEDASEIDKKIKALDDTEKKSPDIEDLVVNRQKIEQELEKLELDISELNNKYTNANMLLKKCSLEYDNLTRETVEGTKALRKIEILEEVLAYFDDKIKTESQLFSEKLQANIQSLIDEMLTSKRTVSVSPEFAVRVIDSYQDESKSEGQFAVVSFAYIGGILRMLQSIDELSDKEYPLILDGPFSKLDPEQRQNVVNTIPEFAPQVILFSKDSLQDVLRQSDTGRVWTIQSNEEKNIATVEEGYLWK